MEDEIEIDEDIVNNFGSDNEIEEDEQSFNNIDDIKEIIHYNKNEYEFNFIYNNLVNMKILVNHYSCPICFKKMNISNDKGVLDKKVFCCVSNNPKHDKNISLRINSVFENIKAPLFILYFVTF